VQSRQFRALVAEEERQGSTAVTLMQLLEVESLMSACSSAAHFAKDAMPARRRPQAISPRFGSNTAGVQEFASAVRRGWLLRL
jgi:hypothetical protein